MVWIRRRGTAIVETPKGILVVSKDGKNYILPGGGAKRDESERDATAREIREETGVEASGLVFLFKFMGPMHEGPKGGLFRNAHSVFLVSVKGTPSPSQEISHLAYYNGLTPKISFSARKIIERYRSTKKG